MKTPRETRRIAVGTAGTAGGRTAFAGASTHDDFAIAFGIAEGDFHSQPQTSTDALRPVSALWVTDGQQRAGEADLQHGSSQPL